MVHKIQEWEKKMLILLLLFQNVHQKNREMKMEKNFFNLIRKNEIFLFLQPNTHTHTHKPTHTLTVSSAADPQTKSSPPLGTNEKTEYDSLFTVSGPCGLDSSTLRVLPYPCTSFSLCVSVSWIYHHLFILKILIINLLWWNKTLNEMNFHLRNFQFRWGSISFRFIPR